MDRTAWIVVALCVLGLVLWEIYSFRQIQPRPVTPVTTRSAVRPTVSFSPTPAPAAPSPIAAASPPPSPSIAPFPETTETLRNTDLELHLTNRGGGITKAVLLNHVGEQDRRVTLNSDEHPPIGAIVDEPNSPVFPEYKINREGDAISRVRWLAGAGWRLIRARDQ